MTIAKKNELLQVQILLLAVNTNTQIPINAFEDEKVPEKFVIFVTLALSILSSYLSSLFQSLLCVPFQSLQALVFPLKLSID